MHLELTESLTLPDCINAVRRFVARRGLPSTIYSDNAKTFKAFSKQLQGIFGPMAPRWKFIAPRSPWWGGWWERLVRSVKNSLKKVLGKRSISRNELETLLMEIEACINSRPLTFASGELDYENPLTPAHFLISRPHFVQIPITESTTAVTGRDLRDKEIARAIMLNEFWSSWTNKYIVNLPSINQGYRSNCRLKLGSIVLMRDDELPRMSWPLGKIVKLFPGNDGIARTVEVKTSRGNFIRSIQRIHDLEVHEEVSNPELLPEGELSQEILPEGELNEENLSGEGAQNEPRATDTPTVYTTRVGRKINPPTKMSL